MLPTKTISIITANYYPEDTAIGLYTTLFAKHLKSKGFAVNIITGFPYYPQWQILDSYKEKEIFHQEEIDGIHVFRYKIYIPNKVNFIGRIKMMISFIKGAIRNISKVKNTDLVICIVPFTFSIIPAYLLSKKRKAKLWIHIQDFEFDLAFETGIFNTPFTSLFKKSFFRIERLLLNKSDIISTISFNMIDKTLKKTKKTNKEIFYFPNWVSAEKINPNKYNHHNYINKNKFTILYSGNIGQKQNWHVFVDLCKFIKEEDNIEILIVGNGSYLKELKLLCTKFNFVRFFEPVPFNELNNLLCSANMHFLFQKTDVIDTVMPSKILGMMASEKPSIVTGNDDSEVKKVFNESNCGYFLSENKSSKIYSLILKLKNNPSLSKDFGISGRNYVLANYSEEIILNNFSNKIEYMLNE